MTCRGRVRRRLELASRRRAGNLFLFAAILVQDEHTPRFQAANWESLSSALGYRTRPHRELSYKVSGKYPTRNLCQRRNGGAVSEINCAGACEISGLSPGGRLLGDPAGSVAGQLGAVAQLQFLLKVATMSVHRPEAHMELPGNGMAVVALANQLQDF